MSKRHAPRGPIKAKDGDPMEAPNPMEGRCTATNRQGNRCGKAAIPGGVVCRMHGGAAPQVQVKAQERLRAMQPLALDTMEALMRRKEYPTVQFQASKAIIDWTEGKAAELVNVNLNASVRELSDEELRARALELAGVKIASGG